MYRFHTTIHARPMGVELGDTVEIDGVAVRTLRIEPTRASALMTVSFEEASDKLAQLPRMFVEPDGSFVWTSGDGPWQVDGVLYDRGGKLVYVEAKGECPPTALDQLLSGFGWPGAPLMFQLAQQAVFLDEMEFRRCARVMAD